MGIKDQTTKLIDTDSSNIGASVTQRGSKGAQSVEIVDDAGNQIVNLGSDNYSTVGDGTQTVTTAGTSVQVASDTSCKRVYVQAHESNRGRIVVGGSTVVAKLTGRRGRAFYKTQGGWFPVNNLNLLWMDATMNGDKVTYFYVD